MFPFHLFIYLFSFVGGIVLLSAFSACGGTWRWNIYYFVWKFLRQYIYIYINIHSFIHSGLQENFTNPL